MLQVTTEAKELLRAIDPKDDGVLRLEALDTGELGFVSGPAQAGDQVVEEAGVQLLNIAAPVSDQFDGQALARVESPTGPGLTIRPPQN
ncbi:MAG: hypothetical protein ACREOV_08765 [Candidatus Dormibacteraceae bacterium]